MIQMEVDHLPMMTAHLMTIQGRDDF